MRSLVAAAILLLLAACNADDVGDDMGSMPLTDVERCEEMALCGRSECIAEIAAVDNCNRDTDCSLSDEMRDPLFNARNDCLEREGCNTTDCTVSPMGVKACPNDTEANVYDASLNAMHSGDVTTCDALE